MFWQSESDAASMHEQLTKMGVPRWDERGRAYLLVARLAWLMLRIDARHKHQVAMLEREIRRLEGRR